MTLYILRLLGLVGIVNILTRSYLFEPIRNKLPWACARYFVNCPQCVGFWVGGIFSLFCATAMGVNGVGRFFIWGGAVSLLSSAVVARLDYLSFQKSELLGRMSVYNVRKVAEDGQDAED